MTCIMSARSRRHKVDDGLNHENNIFTEIKKICICNRDKRERECQVQCAAVFTQSHPKIILVTLLFFSSSNTGFFGRGEGDWINVALMGISGSAKTIPEIKMTKSSSSTLEI